VLHGSLAAYSGEAISDSPGGPGYQIQITGNASGYTYSGEYHC
jgi:hypothetical protein